MGPENCDLNVENSEQANSCLRQLRRPLIKKIREQIAKNSVSVEANLLENRGYPSLHILNNVVYHARFLIETGKEWKERIENLCALKNCDTSEELEIIDGAKDWFHWEYCTMTQKLMDAIQEQQDIHRKIIQQTEQLQETLKIVKAAQNTEELKSLTIPKDNWERVVNNSKREMKKLTRYLTNTGYITRLMSFHCQAESILNPE